MKKKYWIGIVFAIVIGSLFGYYSSIEAKKEEQKMYSLDEYQKKFSHQKEEDR